MTFGLVGRLSFVDGDHAVAVLTSERSTRIPLSDQQARRVAIHDPKFNLSSRCGEVDRLPVFKGSPDVTQPGAQSRRASVVPAVRRVELSNALERCCHIALPLDRIAVEVKDTLQRIAKNPTRQIARKFHDDVVLNARAVLIFVDVEAPV